MNKYKMYRNRINMLRFWIEFLSRYKLWYQNFVAGYFFYHEFRPH
jgi:hypothetical protein